MIDAHITGTNGLELLRRILRISPGTQAIGLEAVCGGAVHFLQPVEPRELLSPVTRRLCRSQTLAELERDCAAHDDSPASNSERLGDNELFQVVGLHSMRVANYAVLLGQAYGLPTEQLRSLELGALLHDIGKVAIPRDVLLKPAALNEKEWKVMRTHPRIGYQLLVDLPAMKQAVQVVYAHHERYDGKGYPRRLKRDEIPVAARLFSIVDTVDAITCNRPYRKAQPFEKACDELRKGCGTQFDPQAVDVFFTLPQAKLQEIRDRLTDTE